jgi:predicted ferric reductase
MNSCSYGDYVWPALLLMGLDRFLRALRLVIYNLGYILAKRPAGLDARVDILSPDFLRVSFNRPQHIDWAPGQNAYLSMPGIAPFQFHPFTISTIDVREMPLSKSESETRSAYSSATDVQQLAFLVRVRKGFTASLLRNAQDNKLLKVFFDGPYGSPPILKGYGTVLLIAGKYSALPSSDDGSTMFNILRWIWSVLHASPFTRPPSVSVRLVLWIF